MCRTDPTSCQSVSFHDYAGYGLMAAAVLESVARPDGRAADDGIGHGPDADVSAHGGAVFRKTVQDGGSSLDADVAMQVADAAANND
ncbi:hypothetical protein [Halopseudomonas salegens]|uniref:Uncharacterized protein n=1 Tax=Halopseudomonas salegens TaxID=1434072 RepID=A0A1H2FES7_9GAMM|nr:hypothetical protein [Halopseudomonas salegens]SDU05799.1 hypothetical protein SAMN05216210_1500 [Halopseudomonas salegens]